MLWDVIVVRTSISLKGYKYELSGEDCCMKKLLRPVAMDGLTVKEA